eukprot:8655612-Ditylum_brightwellii.AAC.1
MKWNGNTVEHANLHSKTKYGSIRVAMEGGETSAKMTQIPINDQMDNTYGTRIREGMRPRQRRGLVPRRDVATLDTPNAFMQADVDGKVHMKNKVLHNISMLHPSSSSNLLAGVIGWTMSLYSVA